MVELCLLKLQPDGTEEKKTWKFDPEVPIDAKIAKLIGVTDEDVKGRPVFKSLAHNIYDFIGSADVAGFNLCKLDLPLLMEEFMRAGIEFDIAKRKIVDVQRIFHMMEKRNLAAAYQFYCGKELIDEHSAEADTVATFEVFFAQLGKYQELGDNVDAVVAATGNPNGNIVDIVGRITMENDRETFNFGKYKGQAIEDVLRKDPAYYGWMMNGDFTSYTKKKMTEIRLRLKNN